MSRITTYPTRWPSLLPLWWNLHWRRSCCRSVVEWLLCRFQQDSISWIKLKFISDWTWFGEHYNIYLKYPLNKLKPMNCIKSVASSSPLSPEHTMAGVTQAIRTRVRGVPVRRLPGRTDPGLLLQSYPASVRCCDPVGGGYLDQACWVTASHSHCY